MRFASLLLVLVVLAASGASASEGRLFARLAGPEVVEFLRGTNGGRALVSGVLGREIRAVTNDDLARFGEELLRPEHAGIAAALETRLLRLERSRAWLAAHREAAQATAIFNRFAEVELAGLVGELEAGGFRNFALTRDMFLSPEMITAEEIRAMGMRPPRPNPHPLDIELGRMLEGQSDELLRGMGREFPAPWATDTEIVLGEGWSQRLGDLLPAPLRNSEAFASRFTGWRIGTTEGGFFGRPLVAEADLGAYGTLQIEIHGAGGIRATVFHPVGVDLAEFGSKVRFATAETRRLTGERSFNPRARHHDGVGGGMTEIRGLSVNDAPPASGFLQLLTSVAPL